MKIRNATPEDVERGDWQMLTATISLIAFFMRTW